jgi:hypothetical protein
MKKLNANTIIFEVTRRCNMHCAHCLRGDAQNIDMPLSVMDKALDYFDSVETVGFGGGEISIAPEKLDELLSITKAHNLHPASFYGVTNGKVVSDDFLLTMLRWYRTVMENGGEPEMSGLAFSSDCFHEPIPAENREILRGFSFFRENDKKTDWNKLPLINEGRAKSLIGYKKRELAMDGPEIDISGDAVTIDIAYVTCDGDVLCTCDAAYDDQERFRIGNIYDPEWVEKMLSKFKCEGIEPQEKLCG